MVDGEIMGYSLGGMVVVSDAYKPYVLVMVAGNGGRLIGYDYGDDWFCISWVCIWCGDKQ